MYEEELKSEQKDDAITVIQELDAILDIHEEPVEYAMCDSSGVDCDLENHVQDCLKELDIYLEQIDENDDSTMISSKVNQLCLPSNSETHSTLNAAPVCVKKSGSNINLQRSHGTRKTISCPAENQFNYLKKFTNRNCLCKDAHCTNNSKEMNMVKNEEECEAKAVSVNSSTTQLCLPPETITQNTLEKSTPPHHQGNELISLQCERQDEACSRTSMPTANDNANCEILNVRTVQPIGTLLTHAAVAYHTNFTSMGSDNENNGSNNYNAPITSDGSTMRSSQNTDPVSIVSSSSSSVASESLAQAEAELVFDEITNNTSDARSSTTKRNCNATWPYNCSRTIALLSCSLGLFNVCRFGVLTINYGGNFLLQFLLLSILFGIPFFWLQMCLGAKIKEGPVSMWRISPICTGVGFSLVIVQFVIALYSSVVMVWILLYLLDTLTYQPSYRWMVPIFHSMQRNQTQDDTLANLTDNISNYFNIVILKRMKFMLPSLYDERITPFRINDHVATSLVVLWLSVFLILCKGLQTLGRVLIYLGIASLIGLIVIVGKLLTIVNFTTFQYIFSSTEMDDFLINSKTWGAAAQETFLTWGLLGASVISITSRSLSKVSKTALRRDAVLVVILTISGLCLAALLGLSSIEILSQAAFIYIPGSYENPESSRSIYSVKTISNANLISYPSKLVPHYSGFIGETYSRSVTLREKESGYQILRFVTELLPAVTVIMHHRMCWIWTAVIFLILFLFGLNQLCIIWHPISHGLGNTSRAIFVSCLCALLLSIPFATNYGMSLLHYVDFVMGGAWFVPILWTLQIFGVFLVRGRPYNGDHLVNDLGMPNSISAYLALSWNVLLPIGLITLSIINYKISFSSQLYYWRVKSQFPYWARKVGALTQISIVLLIPIVAIVQICRYLSSGPQDILNRIELLYRPPEVTRNDSRGNRVSAINRRLGVTGVSNERDFSGDAPPKYTPPPSYTTATGTRLAKLLRNSIRRSLRRSLRTNNRLSSILPRGIPSTDNLPNNHTNVFTHSSNALNDTNPSISETIEIDHPPNSNEYQINRTFSLGRKTMLQRRRNQYPRSDSQALHRNTQLRRTTAQLPRPYTADDVITILRSSTMNRRTMRHSMSGCSHENLVLNAEPLAVEINEPLQHEDQEKREKTKLQTNKI